MSLHGNIYIYLSCCRPCFLHEVTNRIAGATQEVGDGLASSSTSHGVLRFGWSFASRSDCGQVVVLWLTQEMKIRKMGGLVNSMY